AGAVRWVGGRGLDEGGGGEGSSPRLSAGRAAPPPMASVFLQGGLALLLVFTHKIGEMIEKIGVLLTLMSALTVLSLFRRPREAGKPALACALVFFGLSAWMIVTAGARAPSDLVWVRAVGAVSIVGYLVTPKRAG